MAKPWDTDQAMSMGTGRKIATTVSGALVLWIAGLAIAGALYGGRAGQRVAARIADSLLAEVTVKDANLALVRGRLELEGLAVKKEDLGHLAIDVADVRCELPPLGLALVDRECRSLVIDRVRLQVTAAAVLTFHKPRRAPLRVRRVEINDAVLTFSPSALVPQLGQITINIRHVVAGPTTFKTPLSWIFSIETLQASIELPAGVVVELGYVQGVFTAQGSIFGSTPVSLPITLPPASSADDAGDEIRKLFALGKQLATELVERRARDWVKSKLHMP